MMKFSQSLSLAVAFFVFNSPSANAFAGMSNNGEMSRRESFANAASAILRGGGAAAVATATFAPSIASAYPSDETQRIVTRMGGLLEKFADTQRGLSINIPSGWNKFEGEVGAYDIKWQDLVDPKENIKISSTPVKSTTTSVAALGDDVQAIGENLASKRNAKLVKAQERLTDGILFYEFEFAIGDATHQLLSLSVNKGKIWSLDCNTTEKRWSKREEMYYNVIGSFIPRLV